MEELEKARQARDKTFNKFVHFVELETKSGLNARKWRNEHRIHADEVRALERDILSSPITPMYEKSN